MITMGDTNEPTAQEREDAEARLDAQACGWPEGYRKHERGEDQ